MFETCGQGKIEANLKDKFHGKCNLTQHCDTSQCLTTNISKHFHAFNILNIWKEKFQNVSQSDIPSDWNNYTWLASDHRYFYHVSWNSNNHIWEVLNSLTNRMLLWPYWISDLSKVCRRAVTHLTTDISTMFCKILYSQCGEEV